MNILWFGDPLSFDPNLVGGKAANLSRLASMYNCVPDGFIVPATMLEQPDPVLMETKIKGAISKLSACHGIKALAAAVRSSAIDEDGMDLSFAGQYETFLNVSGAGAILDAVQRCRDSVNADRVFAYRRQHSLSEAHLKMSVLVQQMIAADVSVVAFSANPLSGNRNEILINASWGLGESIVGGTVTPDTFVVQKSDGTITNEMIADKKRMHVPIPGGTKEVAVPGFLRKQASLSSNQILETIELILSLEDNFGYPVDIECAYSNGQLHLLQCRPITTK